VTGKRYSAETTEDRPAPHATPPSLGAHVESRIVELLRDPRIDVEFATNRKEEQAASSAMGKARYPRWFRQGLIPVSVGLGGLFLVLDFLAGDFTQIRTLLTALGLGLGFGLGFLILNRRLGQGRWSRRAVVSPEGFREEPAFRSLWPWSRVSSVQETPEFFLFSAGFLRGFRFIPKRVLSAPDIDDLRNLIRDNIWEAEKARLLRPGTEADARGR